MKRLFLLGLTMAAVGCAATPVAAPETERALTFANVRSYFSDTLKFRPTEVQKRCVIFYEGEWVSPQVYNYCVIILENSDEDLQITFYITDAREMNWVNEFIDSPFFSYERDRESLPSSLSRTPRPRRTRRPVPGRPQPLGAEARPDHRPQLHPGARMKSA